MCLKEMDICRSRSLAKQARKLYLRAFPAEERIPWWLLRMNAARKGIDLTAWLDGDAFCGFTASVTVEGLHFLLFFAVEETIRGKGYGSRILQQIRRSYDLVNLNVEPLLSSASNLDERQKRFAFYKKNGFHDTGWYVWEIGGKFRVLSTQPRLDVRQYRKVFLKLTLGLWRVKLLQASRTEECGADDQRIDA